MLVIEGMMLCSGWNVMLLDKIVCGGVDRMESGVSGVGGEYADWETAGTWWAVVTPPGTGDKGEPVINADNS